MKKFILLIMMILTLVGCGEDKVITAVKNIQIGEVEGDTMEDLTLDYINAMILYNVATPKDTYAPSFWETPRKVYELKGERRDDVLDVVNSWIMTGMANKKWINDLQYTNGYSFRGDVIVGINSYIEEEYNEKLEEIHKMYETRIKGKYTPLKKKDIEWFSSKNGMGETVVKAMVVAGGTSYSVVMIPVIEPNGYIYVTNNGFNAYIDRTNGAKKAEMVMNLYEAFPDILDWRINRVTEDFMEVN